MPARCHVDTDMRSPHDDQSPTVPQFLPRPRGSLLAQAGEATPLHSPNTPATPTTPPSTPSTPLAANSTFVDEISPLVLPAPLLTSVGVSRGPAVRTSSSDESMSSALARTLRIIDMFADLSQAETSDVALRDCMNVLTGHVRELCDSFSSHFLVHPVVGPVDGCVEARYYTLINIGSYVRELISTVCEAGTGGHESAPAPRASHWSGFATIPRARCHPSDCLEDAHLSQWHSMAAWWERQNSGPTEEEQHKFFSGLRRRGLVHVPQIGHCTCRKSLDVLFRTVIRLCLTLRHGQLDFSFSEAVRMRGMYDIVTDATNARAMDTVLPSLKLKRRNSQWKLVFDGCGVMPTSYEALQETPRSV